MTTIQPKVKIVIEGTGAELELGVVASVDIQKNCIYLDQMKDGRWRLNYTKSLIPDLSKFEGLKLVREPNG